MCWWYRGGRGWLITVDLDQPSEEPVVDQPSEEPVVEPLVGGSTTFRVEDAESLESVSGREGEGGRERERERGKAGPTPLTELVSKWASKTQCY